MDSIQSIKELVLNKKADAGIIREKGRVLISYPEKPRRTLVHSIAKSVTAMAVGFAINEKIIGLDEKISDIFSERIPVIFDRIVKEKGKTAAKEQIQKLGNIDLSHLLSNTSGQQVVFLHGFQRPYLKDSDWITLCMMNPVVHSPGEVFLYNDANFYLAAKAIQTKTGENLSRWLMSRLFEPLEIPYPTWELDPQGDVIGCGGLLFSMEELHQIGLLCLNQGIVNGRRIIEKDWLKEMTSEKITVDDDCGYGFGFWIATDFYYMYGLGEIYNYISPGRDLLISVEGLKKSF